MTEDLIQLPETKEIKELLDTAKHDITALIKEEPELQTQSKLLLEVVDILSAKLPKGELNQQNLKDKIFIAAHLNFLQMLLEDFFYGEEEEEFEDDEELEDLEDEEVEDEK